MKTAQIRLKEKRFRELNKEDPCDLKPAVIKEKLSLAKILLSYYRDLVCHRHSSSVLDQLRLENQDLKLDLEAARLANGHLNDRLESMVDASVVDSLREQMKQMVSPEDAGELRLKLAHSVPGDRYEDLNLLNHRLKDQVSDLMTAQEQLDNRLAIKTRQLEMVSQQRDTLQKQLKQYQKVSEVVTRFPVRSVNGYTSFSDVWNDKINDPGWHIYLIGGYGVETHLPLVKIGRAKNMKDRFRLYDELQPGYLKDTGQSTFAGRFDLRPGYQFPLGLYRLTDLGIDGNDELYFRMEAVYKAILRSIFADSCLLGQDGRQLEFFRSDDKSIYAKITGVFDQVSDLLTKSGADKVQAMLMQYSRNTLVKRLSVKEPVVVLQDWLASL